MNGSEHDEFEHDHDHHHHHEHELGHEHDLGDEIEEVFEEDAQSSLLLEMRRQNLELLRIAADVAGFTGPHPPLRPGDMRNVLKGIWQIYSEFYTWVDPEEADEEEIDDEDES